MIATLRGAVAAVALDSVVVEVGGVGLRVHTTPGTLTELRPGRDVTLATTLVVREDSLTLYGFRTEDERQTFEILQTVSGVGPRLALAMLAVHEPDGLRRAVATDDLTALMKVPGVGRKGAQRLVLELGDRLGPPGRADSTSTRVSTDADGWRPQVRDALVGLGWSAKLADDALDAVVTQLHLDDGVPVDVAAVLRAALRTLGRT